MKTIALLIPILLTQTSLAGITHIEDRRNANAILDLFGEPSSINPSISDSTFLFYNNPNEVLNHSINSSITDPIIGSSNTSITYESSLSTTRFYSSVTASATATTLEGGNIAFANTGFGNRVLFTLNNTTTFQIRGFLSGEESAGGTQLVFGSVVDDSDIWPTVFSASAFDGTYEIDSQLTLEAGEYYFSTVSFASAVAASNNQTAFAQAAHEITVTVVPAPASAALLFLTGSVIITRRHR